MRATVSLVIAVVGFSLGAASPAAASDWGCQVLLCLANPGGPTQYGACVPPITRLWRALARGKAFPKCTGGGVASAIITNPRSTTGRSVMMRFTDGTTRTYVLPEPEQAASGSNLDAGR